MYLGVQPANRHRGLLNYRFWFADWWFDGIGIRLILKQFTDAIAQQPLHALDRVTVAIEQFTDPHKQSHVFRSIIPAPAASLKRMNLRKLGFPKPQNMRRHIQIISDLTDGPERGG